MRRPIPRHVRAMSTPTRRVRQRARQNQATLNIRRFPVSYPDGCATAQDERFIDPGLSLRAHPSPRPGLRQWAGVDGELSRAPHYRRIRSSSTATPRSASTLGD